MEKEALLCSVDADEMVSQQPKRCKAGLITMPFIIANEALARMASLGLLSNMILYLMGSYKLHLGQATQILLLFSAASNFTPIVGAFVADPYLGQFLGVGLGSAVSFLGMTLLWLTAMIPAARPPACSHLTEGCKSATKGQMTMLLSAFSLMSIGNGGRSCSIAFGADQVTRRTSLFTGFAQVTVAAYKNRKLSLPPKNSPKFYHHNKDSDLVVPTDKLRFLNKACVIKEHEQVIAPDGSAINPWRLCTVDQVEELKAIVRVIPLWSTGIMMSLNIGGSFGLLQAKSLDRHITSHFEVPAGSFSVIMVAALFICIVLYNRILIPLASKIRGKPIRISAKRRMGIGLLVSFLHLVTAATFETIRRKKAIKEGYLNDTHGVLKMSALWLAPQLCLGGIAEAFNGIGQNEFYYTEFPRTMSSVAASLSGLGMVAGNLVSSFVFITIENVTSRGEKEGWISDNINLQLMKYLSVIALLLELIRRPRFSHLQANHL
ncbi:protein NRT1/ PTR FAMILY 1.2-like isoform X3 [Trifolium pratense]|uniref:protein NRT1/ PTR FAMILY 1.2-like isoform X3 n=1 Tax=Trifolium pratense TaxID=57577 RepID=UPI001E690482|nr:protein NRT1/ PTR FAMILY 1.2-like isoform X3 [Trifolium pratense]